MPLSQATLLDINPPEKHGQAMALYGMGSMLGGIIGPALGGWLTDWLSWRAVFLINVPFGTLACIGMYAFMFPSARKVAARFDIFGFAALSVVLASLQLVVDRGQQLDWFEFDNLHRGDRPRRVRLCFPGPHLLGQFPLHQAGAVQGPQLPRRLGHQCRAGRAGVRRHAADRHHAAADAWLSGCWPAWCRRRAG